jgi:gamma-glutamyl phosphate reductase
MDNNYKIEIESIKSLAAKLNMTAQLLKSMINLNEATKKAVEPYRNKQNPNKNKRNFPVTVVKIIYETLGYPNE